MRQGSSLAFVRPGPSAAKPGALRGTPRRQHASSRRAGKAIPVLCVLRQLLCDRVKRLQAHSRPAPARRGGSLRHVCSCPMPGEDPAASALPARSYPARDAPAGGHDVRTAPKGLPHAVPAGRTASQKRRLCLAHPSPCAFFPQAFFPQPSFLSLLSLTLRPPASARGQAPSRGSRSPWAAPPWTSPRGSHCFPWI